MASVGSFDHLFPDLVRPPTTGTVPGTGLNNVFEFRPETDQEKMIKFIFTNYQTGPWCVGMVASGYGIGIIQYTAKNLKKLQFNSFYYSWACSVQAVFSANCL
jgi:hypothetical protein